MSRLRRTTAEIDVLPFEEKQKSKEGNTAESSDGSTRSVDEEGEEPDEDTGETTAQYSFHHYTSIRDILREDWNAVWSPADSPFTHYDYLHALEESGSVSPANGWAPLHVLVRPKELEEGGDGERVPPVACVPVYVKSHSMGEFLLDHDWADFASEHVIPYYPKLVVGVPFTPCEGSRLLIRRDLGADERALLQRSLGSFLRMLVEATGLSSAHVLFCKKEEAASLQSVGFVRQMHAQMVWKNEMKTKTEMAEMGDRGFKDLTDFLSTLPGNLRARFSQLRRERKKLQSKEGVEAVTLTGDEIDENTMQDALDIYRVGVVTTFPGPNGGAAMTPSEAEPEAEAEAEAEGGEEFRDESEVDAHGEGERVRETISRDPYLNEDFFWMLYNSPWRRHLHVTLLRDSDGATVAGSVAVMGHSRLYSRYWAIYKPMLLGTRELLLWEPLETTMKFGLLEWQQADGAGDFRAVPRGMEPRRVYSAHFVRDGFLRRQVNEVLEERWSQMQGHPHDESKEGHGGGKSTHVSNEHAVLRFAADEYSEAFRLGFFRDRTVPFAPVPDAGILAERFFPSEDAQQTNHQSAETETEREEMPSWLRWGTPEKLADVFGGGSSVERAVESATSGGMSLDPRGFPEGSPLRDFLLGEGGLLAGGGGGQSGGEGDEGWEKREMSGMLDPSRLYSFKGLTGSSPFHLYQMPLGMDLSSSSSKSSSSARKKGKGGAVGFTRVDLEAFEKQRAGPGQAKLDVPRSLWGQFRWRTDRNGIWWDDQKQAWISENPAEVSVGGGDRQESKKSQQQPKKKIPNPFEVFRADSFGFIGALNRAHRWRTKQMEELWLPSRTDYLAENLSVREKGEKWVCRACPEIVWNTPGTNTKKGWAVVDPWGGHSKSPAAAVVLTFSVKDNGFEGALLKALEAVTERRRRGGGGGASQTSSPSPIREESGQKVKGKQGEKGGQKGRESSSGEKTTEAKEKSRKTAPTRSSTKAGKKKGSSKQAELREEETQMGVEKPTGKKKGKKGDATEEGTGSLSKAAVARQRASTSDAVEQSDVKKAKKRAGGKSDTKKKPKARTKVTKQK
uniref:Uncharacterized protein n=1 Tax=Chromera velia CCMP2878 TaxID=1169474 RepID=A0A0G4G6F9_9ALVE|eukprot:Cvel_20499.t1-p1 / transcript=Cvel_20499.t1 / gene=Cvel_20499 / organism=Chromera_velia_CCMP2878 / gene_product=hypothetical protein / transcript_product=hypothetical protein / location=Cvel_scaffold1844:17145-24397(+) / protein_length=1071 / sequence_SO=supercontig / SO=protein_coding / is_pseudo=false